MKRFALVALVMGVALSLCVSSVMAQEGKFPTNKPENPNVLTAKEKADGWKLIFDGKSLKGWNVYKGEWDVPKDSGMIVGTEGTGHLLYNKKQKDCELQWWVCTYDVAIPKHRFGNSGVFLRGIITDSAWPQGYEIQVDPYDINNPTGGIYGRATGDLLVKDGKWIPKAFLEVHEGKWIHQRAKIVGNNVKIWINGELTLDWDDEDNAFSKAGVIALQVHHPTCVVLFSGIKLKELD